MPLFIKTISASIISLIFARIMYAINWFNISSITYLILIDFREDISMLGLITASFLIGIGIFQIPAGILAAKYNPKKIAFSGVMILSVASLLSGLTIELSQIVILRFFVGVGMAFFFGPSVVLISSYLGKGSEGLGVGILNSAHSIGGIIGIFGWIAIAELVGWRTSLILSGSLGLISGLFLICVKRQKQIKNNENYKESRDSLTNHSQNTFINQGDMKNKNTQTKFKIKFEDLKTIMTNKSMIWIGLSLLGIQISWNLVSTFTVIYLKNEMYVNSIIAGFIAGLPMLFNVIFSPIFGKIYDKANKKTERNPGILLLIISSLIVSSNIAFMSIANIYTITLSIIFIGIFISGGFVVPYTKARELATINLGQPQYETFAISFINGVSLFGAFWAPFVFSNIVKYFDYSLAWLIGGIITFMFIIPVTYFQVKKK